ncbi:hypothetical protein ACO0LF_25740 [Undibacterium sp. Di27W]|uniref:hypothetical protein n=1 Tax=Undibacterium sp. Di27W TaxID=3413036 RepID=UPI003BF438AF
MKTMISLLKREFWEHTGMFLWTPLSVAAAMICVFTMPFLFGQHLISAHVLDRVGRMRDDTQRVGDALASIYMLSSGPLLIAMAGIIFFYCLACLHDDRRDRSILFWKSLPVSDFQTVLSKLLVACLVVPLIFLTIATAMSFCMLMILSIAFSTQEVFIFKDLLANGKLYLTPLQIAGILPVYILWALPSLCWLMLVSSWARSKVFLWAVGIPLLVVFLIGMLKLLIYQDADMQWFVDLILGRSIGSLVPGAWIRFESIPLNAYFPLSKEDSGFERIFMISWHTLTSLQLWLGVLLAACMFYMTVRLRRWREAA